LRKKLTMNFGEVGKLRLLAVTLAAAAYMWCGGCTWKTEGTYEAEGDVPLPRVGTADL